MKTIKIILLLVTISVFTSISSTAEARRNCSEVRWVDGFHKRILCEFGSKKYGREYTEEEIKAKLEKKAVQEKTREDSDTLEDMAKKIPKKDPNSPKTLKDFFKDFKLPKAFQPKTE